jgi:hypothetical protein
LIDFVRGTGENSNQFSVRAFVICFISRLIIPMSKQLDVRPWM